MGASVVRARLAYLLAAGLLCGAATIHAQGTYECVGGGCGGAGFSSPVTTDPVSATGAWVFDNVAGTAVSLADGASGPTLVGTTSVCGGGAADAANSVCITANTAIFEGATANTFETFLVAGDATADNTLTLTGTSTGVTAAITTGAFHFPSTTSGVLSFGTNTTDPYLASYYSGTTGGIKFGRDGVSSTGLLFADNSSATLSNANGQIRLSPSASGQVVVTAAQLTSATMTAETQGGVRTLTHSYTWSNAQVVALGAVLVGDITVATLPAKIQLVDALVVITGAAVGPTTVTVSCGDAIAGTPFINYVVASDAKAAANTVYGDAVAERGTSIDAEFFYLPSYTATTLVTCHFISTGANLNTVTGSTGRVILTTRLLP